MTWRAISTRPCNLGHSDPDAAEPGPGPGPGAEAPPPPPNDVPLHYFGAGLKNVLSLLARVLQMNKGVIDYQKLSYHR